LGCNGIHEIKEHPWLKDYPWKDLSDRKIVAPFIPRNGDNFDKRYCEGVDKIGNETLERYRKHYKSKEYSNQFRNYTFFSNDFKARTRTSSKSTMDRIIETRNKCQSRNPYNNFFNVTKPNGRNDSATIPVKVISFSPIRVQGNLKASSISNSNFLKENKSLIINKSTVKLYSKSPLLSYREGSKILDKLPSLDLNKITNNNLIKSTSVSNVKKSNKFSTISIDSNSLNSFIAMNKRGSSLVASKKKVFK
jgi:hypothetical protein